MGEDYFKRRQAAVEQRTRWGGVGDRTIRELLGHSHMATRIRSIAAPVC